MPSVGSLFSGIGGFELGFEWAGFDVAWQVENDPFCCRVLAHHWPDVPRFGDVRTVRGVDLAPVDWIIGGFPCQDLSSAGTRAGLTGPRSGLYREFLRIIDERGPAGVVIENSGHAWRQWVPVLRRALWARGYSSLPLHMRARDFGAWHIRHRVYLVAHVDQDVVRLQSWRWRWPFWSGASVLADAAQNGCHVEESAIGGECGQRRRADASRRAGAANPDAEGQLQQGRVEPDESRRPRDGAWWPPEPDVDRVFYGVPSRAYGRWLSDRVGAQGNAVCPPIAYFIARTIRELTA